LTIKAVKKNPWMLLVALIFGSYIVAILTNAIPVAIFMFTLLASIFRQVGYKPGEKTPTMILLAVAITQLMANILWPWLVTIAPLNAFSQGTGIEIAHSTYISYTLVLSVIVMTFLIVTLRVTKCDIAKLSNVDLSFLDEEYKDGISAKQKVVLGTVLVYVVGMVAIAFFPKSITSLYPVVTSGVGIVGWHAIIIGFLLFVEVDHKPVLNAAQIAAHVPWDLIFIIGLGVLVGTQLASEPTGFSAWITGIVGPVLGSMSEVAILLIIALLALILTNLLNNNAVMILFATIIASLTTSGVITQPVLAVLLAIFAAELGFVTPASSMYGALIHANEYTMPASAYKYGMLLFMVCLLILVVIAIPIGMIML